MQTPAVVKIFIPILFLAVSFVSYGQTYTIDTVPNDKLTTGSYVSNPDGIITAETVSTIDATLRQLEDSSTAQVAVVMLKSIGDTDEFTFALDLFNKWGLGQASNNNGLLILYVGDRHVIRFQTGDGIEGVLPDITCKRIQMEEMVPYFKNGEVDNGMIAGINRVAQVLSDPEVAALYTDAGQSSQGGADVSVSDFIYFTMAVWLVVMVIVFIVKLVKKRFRTDAAAPQAKVGGGIWFLWYIVVPLVGMGFAATSNTFLGFAGGLYAWTAGALLLRRNAITSEASRWEAKKDYHAIYNLFQQQQGTFSAMRFLFPLPFAFMFNAFRQKMQFYRDHPRDCKECGKPMTKLNEKADDAFLSKSQLLEESLKSVDYDIWNCTSCDATDELSYVNEDSKYKACPKCQTRAYYEVSNRTIKAATTSSSGSGEQIHQCKNCNERTVRRYTIPRKESSSSSSSSGSSSSGGSWGGGSSSGGGASSSW
jgi:uncharacterized protein